ncbi:MULTISPECIES: bacteriocin-like protein [Chryseobacterium]|uniref:Bacteriocin-type signal sequence-containing protein n=1 Tax=Chryseobacterium gambrini TaxID=373672 RepID=A0ABM8KCH8_9FLAO|nr:hypothetical protein [Chryseobacterium sp. SL1]MBL7879717.1 hypothetical protein [Chryseobacterium gambrini]MCY1660252.1 hypothetical protein [Chryseobacterium sp. SL1]BEV05814.1 hypothetical protein CRDW_31880 [Chryseobacterium gambrini]
MKNLKKLSRPELKSLNGGWYDCGGPFPPAICKCKRGQQLCPDGTCRPANAVCP